MTEEPLMLLATATSVEKQKICELLLAGWVYERGRYISEEFYWYDPAPKSDDLAGAGGMSTTAAYLKLIYKETDR